MYVSGWTAVGLGTAESRAVHALAETCTLLFGLDQARGEVQNSKAVSRIFPHQKNRARVKA